MSRCEHYALPDGAAKAKCEKYGVSISASQKACELCALGKPPKPRRLPNATATRVACIHRKPAKRTETLPCCGDVEVFDCPRLGHEVFSTKCKTCDQYEREPAKYKAIVVAFPEKGSVNALPGALEQLGFEVEVHQRGTSEWPNLVKASIEKRRPDLFCCFQRLYNEAAKEIGGMLRERAVPELILDFGVWPHYDSVILDPLGENATSALVGSLDALEASGFHRLAADEQKPKLDAIKAEIAEQAHRAEGKLAEMGLEGLPETWIFAALQRTGDMVLKKDAKESRRSSARVLQDIIAEAGRQKKYVVVKTHPFDKNCEKAIKKMPERGKWYRILPRNNADNDACVAWLVSNCAHMVTVSSTMTFTALMAGAEVVTLGPGWYTKNAVTHEYSTIRGAVRGPDQPVPQERKDRYILHALSRQLRTAECADPEKVRRALNVVHAMFAEDSDVTTITCVYAPDERSAKITDECLDAITRELPRARRIAAVDMATDEHVQSMRERGFEVVLPDVGSPPRMSSLLSRAVGSCTSRLVMTVENDVVLEPGSGVAMLERFKGLGARAAGMEVHYKSPNGHMTFPTTRHMKRKPCHVDGLQEEPRHVTWCSSLYRPEALGHVSWKLVPPLGRADIVACGQMRKAGHTFYAATDISNKHYGHEAHRARTRSRSRKTFAIYTAIFGGKDRLWEPEYCEADAQYIAFTDDPTITSETWEVRVVEPVSDNPNLAAKHCKLFPHLYVPEFSVSLWVDGSQQPRRSLGKLMAKHLAPWQPMAVFHNEARHSVYEEIDACIEYDRDDPSKLLALKANMESEEFQTDYVFPWCGVIFRHHWDNRVMDCMAHWWNQITRWTHRDQCTFLYSVEQTECPLCVMTDRMGAYFFWKKHKIDTTGQWRQLAAQDRRQDCA